MNYKLLLIPCLLFILKSCKRDKIELNPKNHLSEFIKTKVQKFDLDTLEFFEIKGENGTKIKFERRDFELSKNEKVTAKLIEIYDFNEILYNNINTITENGELLESSGVINIEFETKGKKLSLKDNSTLVIEFPKDILNKNKLFTAKLDNHNQFEWIEEKQKDTLFSITIGGGLWHTKTISKDSISHYKEINLKATGFETIQEAWPTYNAIDKLNSIGIFKNLGWINVDRIIEPDSYKTFELISNNQKVKNLSIYFVYENLNSFICDYRTIDSLKFNNLPIKNITTLSVIGEYENDLFVDNIILNEIKNKTKVKLNLQKKSKEEIKNILTK
ncbi:conserved protein of unknown function [Tenacibaculum soleae]|uniref:hypothetical protein n=1 Tax=Tenacibaculum soleae TaxID=447689 RepID=UPI003AB15DB5